MENKQASLALLYLPTYFDAELEKSLTHTVKNSKWEMTHT